MDIGTEKETYIIEPLIDPIPRERPIDVPVPVEEPAVVEEPVPA